MLEIEGTVLTFGLSNIAIKPISSNVGAEILSPWIVWPNPFKEPLKVRAVGRHAVGSTGPATTALL